MEQRTESELIAAYRQGDVGALDFLIQRYLPRIYGFQFRMLHDQATAEDLTQETFLKMWRSLKSFDATKSFKTWIFTIAKNVAIDYLRKKKPLTAFPFEMGDEDHLPAEEREVYTDPQPLAPARLAQESLREEIDLALAQLPLKTRSIVLLHDVDDLTFAEIAELSQESLNTIKSRYRRAILFLRRAFPGLGSLPEEASGAPKVF